MRRLVWLDLCSGLGGASQPAHDRGWKVIRVDIDPRFKPDIVADVRALPLRPFHVDVLWASPPCQEFARLAMPWLRKLYPDLTEPDMSIISAVWKLKAEWQPHYFVLENTLHSRKYISTLCGPPRATVPGHCLWGVMPLLPQVKRIPKESLWPREGRAAERAKIPYEIGEAICRAVEARVND